MDGINMRVGINYARRSYELAPPKHSQWYPQPEGWGLCFLAVSLLFKEGLTTAPL